jgi:hypothetical protein
MRGHDYLDVVEGPPLVARVKLLPVDGKVSSLKANEKEVAELRRGWTGMVTITGPKTELWEGDHLLLDSGPNALDRMIDEAFVTNAEQISRGTTSFEGCPQDDTASSGEPRLAPQRNSL